MKNFKNFDEIIKFVLVFITHLTIVDHLNEELQTQIVQQGPNQFNDLFKPKLERLTIKQNRFQFILIGCDMTQNQCKSISNSIMFRDSLGKSSNTLLTHSPFLAQRFLGDLGAYGMGSQLDPIQTTVISFSFSYGFLLIIFENIIVFFLCWKFISNRKNIDFKLFSSVDTNPHYLFARETEEPFFSRAIDQLEKLKKSNNFGLNPVTTKELANYTHQNFCSFLRRLRKGLGLVLLFLGMSFFVTQKVQGISIATQKVPVIAQQQSKQVKVSLGEKILNALDRFYYSGRMGIKTCPGNLTKSSEFYALGGLAGGSNHQVYGHLEMEISQKNKNFFQTTCKTTLNLSKNWRRNVRDLEGYGEWFASYIITGPPKPTFPKNRAGEKMAFVWGFQFPMTFRERVRPYVNMIYFGYTFVEYERSNTHRIISVGMGGKGRSLTGVRFSHIHGGPKVYVGIKFYLPFGLFGYS